MKLSVGLHGLNPALDILRLLPIELQSKVVPQVLRAGARFALRKVKRKAPKRTGGLQSSFEVKRTSRRRNDPRISLLTRKPYAHLIEGGTADRQTKKGYYRGRLLPNPFFSDAIRENRTGINQAMLRTGLRRTKSVLERFASGKLNRGDRRALNLRF